MEQSHGMPSEVQRFILVSGILGQVGEDSHVAIEAVFRLLMEVAAMIKRDCTRGIIVQRCGQHIIPLLVQSLCFTG